MPRIVITPGLSIDDSELIERFVRASGPGGQNVNKVSTAVELRFDAAHSPSLPADVRERLMRLAGHRLTLAGEIVIDAQRFRTQERNRADARERLVALIKEASHAPVPRKKTRVPKGVKRRRLEGKKVRGSVKRNRARPGLD